MEGANFTCSTLIIMINYLALHPFEVVEGANFTCSTLIIMILFVCVEGLQPGQPNKVKSSDVSLPNHTFTGQA